MRKRSLALLAALVFSACTRSDQTGAPEAGAGRQNAYTIPHTLRLGDIQDFDNLNPHLSTAIQLGTLSELTMAYLVRYDAHNRPRPELATEVPTQQNGGVSKDGLTITWHLRHGVRWSDGAPFDADDVVFSTNVVNNPANNEVGRDGWNLITKIDEPDKYTVVFHLKKPYSGYLPTFFGSAGANPCILPKHILGNLPNINQAPYNSKPVGIGPFRYVEWVRGDHVTLEANPYYWRGEPKLKKIVYKVIPDRNTLLTELQTGEIDMWAFVPPAYVGRAVALPNVDHVRGPSYLYMHLDFNTTRPALADQTVREALRLATDRKLLIDKVNHGVGLLQESPESSVSPWYTPIPLVPYDPAKANQLLDQDGWKRGPDGIRAKNGVRLNLEWGTNSGSPDGDARIEQIRSMWKQIGVAITVKHYNPALYFQLTGGVIYGGKFDVTAFLWQMTPDGDLNPINSCTEMPPNGQNVTRLCDPKTIQPLLDQEKLAYDEAARKAIIAKATRAISDRVPYEVLLLMEDVHAYNKDLKNFHPNATTPFDDFMNVDI
ncbi:MAG TPA: peptide ABC transporter substrate-binding protein [Candidatus Limnocylindria bacterium]|nr:peptide ABC transporter substrate-binding protein [Candidatus Limnocylindria bacterium]